MKWLFQRKKQGSSSDVDSDVLMLNSSSLQILVSILLFLALSIFVAGYYWGKKSAVEQLMESLDQESFADKIYISMCSWDESQEDAKDKELDSRGNDMPMEQSSEMEEEEGEEPTSSSSQLYSAQLAGFGSLKAAEAYHLRLQKKGIPAHVVKRQSITAKGNKRIWYQVVTPGMDRTTLDELVKRLIQEDRLTSVSITVNDGTVISEGHLL
jgi:hypothetical protein